MSQAAGFPSFSGKCYATQCFIKMDSLVPLGRFQGAGQGACADSPGAEADHGPASVQAGSHGGHPVPGWGGAGAHGLPWATSPQPSLSTGPPMPGVRWGKGALSRMKGFAHVAPRPTSGPQETLPRLSPSPCLRGRQPGRVDVSSQSQRGTPRDLTPPRRRVSPGHGHSPQDPDLVLSMLLRACSQLARFTLLRHAPRLRCSGAPRSPLTELEKDTHLPVTPDRSSPAHEPPAPHCLQESILLQALPANWPRL